MKKITKKIKKIIYVIYLYSTNYKDIGTLNILYGALAGIVGSLFFFYDKNYYFLSLIKGLIFNLDSNYIIYFSLIFIYLYINRLFDNINYELIWNKEKKESRINFKLKEKMNSFIYEFRVTNPNLIKIEDAETGEVLRDDNFNRIMVVSPRSNNTIITKSVPAVMNTLFSVNNKFRDCFRNKDEFSTMLSWNLLKVKGNSYKYYPNNYLNNLINIFKIKNNNVKGNISNKAVCYIDVRKIPTAGKHLAQIQGHSSIVFLDRDLLDFNRVNIIQYGVTSSDKKIIYPNGYKAKVSRIGYSEKTGHSAISDVPNLLNIKRIELITWRAMDVEDFTRLNNTPESFKIMTEMGVSLLDQLHSKEGTETYDFFKNKVIRYKIKNFNKEEENFFESVLKFFDGKLTMEELRRIDEEYNLLTDPFQQNKYLMKWDEIINNR